jgi:hypothetical protein
LSKFIIYREEDEVGEVRITQDRGWQKLCKAATLELNPVKLQKRIDAAQAAILQRMKELTCNYDCSPAEEHQAIADALQNLRLLQKVNFRTSD